MKRLLILALPLALAAGCKPAAPVEPLSLEAGQEQMKTLRAMVKSGTLTPHDAAFKAEVISERMDSYCEGNR